MSTSRAPGAAGGVAPTGPSAEGCGLGEIQPLVPSREVPELGAGRWGRLPRPATLAEMTTRVQKFLGLRGLQRVGRPEQLVHAVAVACGSAGQFLSAARAAGGQLLVTGETNFHTCLDAEANGVALLLPGHFASERFGVEHLATSLAGQFPGVTVWASRAEQDPLQWITSP